MASWLIFVFQHKEVRFEIKFRYYSRFCFRKVTLKFRFLEPESISHSHPTAFTCAHCADKISGSGWVTMRIGSWHWPCPFLQWRHTTRVSTRTVRIWLGFVGWLGMMCTPRTSKNKCFGALCGLSLWVTAFFVLMSCRISLMFPWMIYLMRQDPDTSCICYFTCGRV